MNSPQSLSVSSSALRLLLPAGTSSNDWETDRSLFSWPLPSPLPISFVIFIVLFFSPFQSLAQSSPTPTYVYDWGVAVPYSSYIFGPLPSLVETTDTYFYAADCTGNPTPDRIGLYHTHSVQTGSQGSYNSPWSAIANQSWSRSSTYGTTLTRFLNGTWQPFTVTYSKSDSPTTYAVRIDQSFSSGILTTTMTRSDTGPTSSSTWASTETVSLSSSTVASLRAHTSSFSTIPPSSFQWPYCGGWTSGTTDISGVVNAHSSLRVVTSGSGGGGGSGGSGGGPSTPTLTLVDPLRLQASYLPLPASVNPTLLTDSTVPTASVSAMASDGAGSAIAYYRSARSTPVRFTLGDNTYGSIGNFTPTYIGHALPTALTGTLVVTDPVNPVSCNSATDSAGTSDCTFLAVIWSPTQMPSTSDTALPASVTATQLSSSGSQLSTSYPYTIVPPPLVLIHGIWSQGADWSNFTTWLYSNYPGVPVTLADYGKYNSLSFADPHVQAVLARSIADSITVAAQRGTVSRKVDVVAHSMGGLVARYLLTSMKSTPLPSYAAILPSAPVHKLVTVGTPHLGSALATSLVQNKTVLISPKASTIIKDLCPGGSVTGCTLGAFFANQNKAIGTGALSLEPSNTRSLLASDTTQYSAVVGVKPTSSATELALNTMIDAFLPGATVTSLLGTSTSDTVVPVTSQMSNATDWVEVNGVVHAPVFPFDQYIDDTETQTHAIWTEVLSALQGTSLNGIVQAEAAQSALFQTNATTTAILPTFDLSGYAQISSSSVAVTPSTGSTLTLGAQSVISVASTNASKRLSEVVIVQKGNNVSAFPLLYSTQEPFNTSFTPQSTGSASLSLFAIFSDHSYAVVPLAYSVTASAPPFALNIVSPPIATLSVGQDLSLSVMAQYQNASVDVTNTASYRVRSGTTKVLTAGVGGHISATGTGVDWLDVTFDGVSTSLPLTVGPCTFRLSNSTPVVSSGGSAITLHVSTATGCNWVVIPDSPWMTPTHLAGSGSTDIDVTIATNSSGTSRIGTLTVGNASSTIVQAPYSCQPSVTQTHYTFTSAGGSGSTPFSVQLGCPVSVSTDVAWILATIGNSTASWLVYPNNSTQSRTGKIVIGGTVISVSQTGEQTALPPVFAPSPGHYSSKQAVTITDNTSGAIIYYTTNGTIPTTSSTKYNGAITVSTTETIEAIAVASGYAKSAVGTAKYTITTPTASGK